MTASSMIQLAPITMGPVIANIVALGWTTVPMKVHEWDEDFTESEDDTRAYRDFTSQIHILTHNCFGVNRKLILSGRN